MAIIKHKIWIIFFLGFGIAGTILFFPVNIQNQYTCLYHRLIHRYSQRERIGAVPLPNDKSPNVNHNHAETKNASPEELNHDELIQHYVFSFGLLWWASLLFVGLSLYHFIQWKRQRKIMNTN